MTEVGIFLREYNFATFTEKSKGRRSVLFQSQVLLPKIQSQAILPKILLRSCTSSMDTENYSECSSSLISSIDLLEEHLLHLDKQRLPFLRQEEDDEKCLKASFAVESLFFITFLSITCCFCVGLSYSVYTSFYFFQDCIQVTPDQVLLLLERNLKTF